MVREQQSNYTRMAADRRVMQAGLTAGIGKPNCHTAIKQEFRRRLSSKLTGI